MSPSDSCDDRTRAVTALNRLGRQAVGRYATTAMAEAEEAKGRFARVIRSIVIADRSQAGLSRLSRGGSEAAVAMLFLAVVLVLAAAAAAGAGRSAVVAKPWRMERAGARRAPDRVRWTG